MKTCNFCENPINDRDKFCSICGYDPQIDTVSPEFRASSNKNLKKNEFRVSGINPIVKIFVFFGLSLAMFSIFYDHEFKIDGVISEFNNLFTKQKTVEYSISPVDTRRVKESKEVSELVNQTMSLSSIPDKEKGEKEKLFMVMLEQFKEKQNKLYEQEISNSKRSLLKRFYEMKTNQEDSKRQLELDISKLKKDIADKRNEILAVKKINRERIKESREIGTHTTEERKEHERSNLLTIQAIEEQERSDLENLNTSIAVLNKRIAVLRERIISDEKKANEEMLKINENINLKQNKQQLELEKKISEVKHLWKKGSSLKDIARVFEVEIK
ncbi:MAG: hypothetical protein ABIA97_03365 [Candidatus Omnitrophota bacterium]